MATHGLFGASQLGAVEGMTGLAKAGGGGGTAQSDIDIASRLLRWQRALLSPAGHVQRHPHDI